MKLFSAMLPMPPSVNGKIYGPWTEEEIYLLRQHYPQKGKMWCCELLNRTEASIRKKAWKLRLKQDSTGEFSREWHARGAAKVTGRKRPDHAIAMKKLYAEGGLNQLKKTPEQCAVQGRKLAELWATKGHPKGAKGLKFTPEALAKISAASKRNWAKMTEDQIRERSIKVLKTTRANGHVKHRKGVTWKGGYRTIGGNKKYYRSRWEANYARYLEFLKERGEIVSWAHEPKTFWFDKIKRGTVSYLPDFLVINPDLSEEYHEVKGWMDERSKTKLRRMTKYFPEIKVVLADKRVYRDLEKKLSSIIPEWEFDK